MHVKKVLSQILRIAFFCVLLVSCAPDQSAAPSEEVVVITAAPDESTPAKRVPIIVGSWRVEDRILWEENIVPVFEMTFPNIKMLFQPTPNTYYSAGLQTGLETGTAADVFVDESFVVSQNHFNKGYLMDLTGMPELEHFSELAKSAWSTSDGKSNYAMPVASVMHGFMYNKLAFEEVGLTVPESIDEFMAVLEAFKQDGRYIPLAFGTADAWQPAVVAYDGVGPTFWKGEEGRWDLINGNTKMTDPIYTDPWKFLASWAPYMPENYESVTYGDGQQLFIQGRAAIRPAGSWEIPAFDGKTDFEIGIFPPPPLEKGGICYVNDWIDLAFAVNKNTEHPDEALQMVQWFGSKDFAELYTNALPGFFTLSDHDIEVKNLIAKEFLTWRENCEMTLRLDGEYLSAGTPDLTSELYRLTQQVMNLQITPEQAGQEAQNALDSWYTPPQ